MLEEMTEGIYKLVVQFPSGMQEVNCYLIEGERGYTVIDTGTYSEEAKAGWEELLKSGVVIEKVVLTHTHKDHIGLAKWFQREKEVPVYTSTISYGEMKKRCETNVRRNIDHLVKRHGGPGVPEEMADDSFIYAFEPNGFFEKNDKIQLGDDIYETIWTPGHAWDHVCFYNEKKQVMIIGDHLLNHISPVIGLWLGEESDVLQEYYDSLERIKTYRVRVALPGHGEAIDHLVERAEGVRDRHDQRLQEVLDKIQKQWKTAHDICQDVYGTLHIILFLSPFMATLTRLIYLEELGKVERKMHDGKVLFRAC
ncbi:MBL fold metallo-hydrolase [Halobacillus shinanisalinarum]|uniref:MBL fold metallo-hydrolase n=1 Tax=Halobacillus shinanisalinarum TaxID=2932258 RepID=A0ABY4GYE1_9BACI|nr:MBL fold metallo-hydrolase [Halobacillus shinanisalinarum]UOQ92894.1 MBL fold metallo-hydrolase [Halobacillus shinanisalinarum]